MLKYIIIFILVIGGAVAYWLTRGPGEDALLGKWHEENNRTVLEFKEDLTWVSIPKDEPQELKIWGTYELTENGTIIMRYSNPPLPAFEHEHEIDYTETELELEPYEGEEVRKFIKRGARAKKS